VKNAITIMLAIIHVSRKSVQLVDVIHMLIGLTDIVAKHTRQKARRNEIISMVEKTKEKSTEKVQIVFK